MRRTSTCETERVTRKLIDERPQSTARSLLPASQFHPFAPVDANKGSVPKKHQFSHGMCTSSLRRAADHRLQLLREQTDQRSGPAFILHEHQTLGVPRQFM